MSYSIYTNGGFEIITKALNSVALIFSDSQIEGVIFALMVAGILITALSIFVSGSLGRRVSVSDLAYTGWWAIALYFLMIAATADVHVYDKVYNRYTTIPDVPKGVAVIASVLSKVEDGFEDIVRTSFIFPDNSSTAEPFTEIYKAMINGYTRLKMPSEIDESNYKTYVSECCVYWAMAPGPNLLTWDEVKRMYDPKTGSRLDDWEDILRKCKTTVISVDMRNSDGTTTTDVTCADAFDQYIAPIFQKLKSEEYLKEFCRGLFFDPDNPSSLNQCKNVIGQLGIMMGTNAASSVIVADILAAKKFYEVLIEGDYISPVEMELSRQVNSFWAGSGMAADKYIPTIRAFMFSLIVLLFPLLALLFVAPGVGVSAARYWLGSMLWVTFWGVIDYVIVCFGIHIGYSSIFDIFRDSTSTIGFSLGILGVERMPVEALKVLVFMGNIRWMGAGLAAAITYGVFRVGGYAFASVASGLGSEAKSAGGQAGRSYVGGDAMKEGFERATRFEQEPLIKEAWTNSGNLHRQVATGRVGWGIGMQAAQGKVSGELAKEFGLGSEGFVDVLAMSTVGRDKIGKYMALRRFLMSLEKYTRATSRPEVAASQTISEVLPESALRAIVRDAVGGIERKGVEKARDLVEQFSDTSTETLTRMLQTGEEIRKALSSAVGFDERQAKRFTESLAALETIRENLTRSFQKSLGLNRDEAEELSSYTAVLARIGIEPNRAVKFVLDRLLGIMGTRLRPEGGVERYGRGLARDLMSKISRILSTQDMRRIREASKQMVEAAEAMVNYGKASEYRDLKSAARAILQQDKGLLSETTSFVKRYSELERVINGAQAVREGRMVVEKDLLPQIMNWLVKNRYGDFSHLFEAMALAAIDGTDSPAYRKFVDDVKMATEKVLQEYFAEKEGQIAERAGVDLERMKEEGKEMVEKVDGGRDAVGEVVREVAGSVREAGEKISRGWEGLRKEVEEKGKEITRKAGKGKLSQGEMDRMERVFLEEFGARFLSDMRSSEKLEAFNDFIRMYLSRRKSFQINHAFQGFVGVVGWVHDGEKRVEEELKALTKTKSPEVAQLVSQLDQTEKIPFRRIAYTLSQATGISPSDALSITGRHIVGLSVLSSKSPGSDHHDCRVCALREPQESSIPATLPLKNEEDEKRLDEFLEKNKDYVAVFDRGAGTAFIVRRDFLKSFLLDPAGYRIRTETPEGREISYNSSSVLTLGEFIARSSMRSVPENSLPQHILHPPQKGFFTGSQDFRDSGFKVRVSGIGHLSAQHITPPPSSSFSLDREKINEIIRRNPPRLTLDLGDLASQMKLTQYMNRKDYADRIWIDHLAGKAYIFSSPHTVKRLEELEISGRIINDLTSLLADRISIKTGLSEREAYDAASSIVRIGQRTYEELHSGNGRGGSFREALMRNLSKGAENIPYLSEGVISLILDGETITSMENAYRSARELREMDFGEGAEMEKAGRVEEQYGKEGKMKQSEIKEEFGLPVGRQTGRGVKSEEVKPEEIERTEPEKGEISPRGTKTSEETEKPAGLETSEPEGVFGAPAGGQIKGKELESFETFPSPSAEEQIKPEGTEKVEGAEEMKKPEKEKAVRKESGKVREEKPEVGQSNALLERAGLGSGSVLSSEIEGAGSERRGISSEEARTPEEVGKTEEQVRPEGMELTEGSGLAGEVRKPEEERVAEEESRKAEREEPERQPAGSVTYTLDELFRRPGKKIDTARKRLKEMTERVINLKETGGRVSPDMIGEGYMVVMDGDYGYIVSEEDLKKVREGFEEF